MFNPFRKNSKVPDLTPTTWEKIRLRAFMVWVAVRALGCRIKGETIAAVIIIPVVLYGVYRFGKHMDAVSAEERMHWENDPCITFANRTVDRVPLRCLPNSPVPDKR